MITINEFKNKLSSGSRLLGIDLGTKRIGIAISDYNQKVATPLQTLDKSKQGKLIDALESIIIEYDIRGIIIGNPINMDGTYGKSSQSAKDIAINISNKIDIPVSLWDERLSTVGAFNLSSELDLSLIHI